MEVIYQKGLQNKSPNEKICNQAPLVFIHGSFHTAWCWAEHWLPFFSENGFDSYALSLLGQGESDSPDGSVAGTLQDAKGLEETGSFYGVQPVCVEGVAHDMMLDSS